MVSTFSHLHSSITSGIWSGAGRSGIEAMQHCNNDQDSYNYFIPMQCVRAGSSICCLPLPRFPPGLCEGHSRSLAPDPVLGRLLPKFRRPARQAISILMRLGKCCTIASRSSRQRFAPIAFCRIPCLQHRPTYCLLPLQLLRLAVPASYIPSASTSSATTHRRNA